MKQFIVPQERIDDLMALVRAEYEKRRDSQQTEHESIDEKIAALRTEAEMTVNKLKVLTNDTALKYMEEDLDRIEKQITTLQARKDTSDNEDISKIEQSMARVKYFLENLDQLLIKQSSAEKKASFFRALFDKLPTYENIKPGNTKTPLFTGVNSLIALLPADKSLMVIPTGVEPVFSG